MESFDLVLKNYGDDLSYQRGKKLANKKHVKELKGELRDDFYLIDGKIKSADLSNTYTVKAVINLNDSTVRASYCSCMDYEKNYIYGNRKHLCKHIIAAIITVKNELLERRKKEKLQLEDKKNNLGKYLLKDVDNLNSKKEKVNLEIFLEFNKKSKKNFSVCFKMGNDRLYVMKNIVEFFEDYESDKKIYFGREFTYDPSKQYFNNQDKEVLNYFYEYYMITKNNINVYKKDFYEGKRFYLDGLYLKNFLYLIKNREVNFIYDDKTYLVKVVEDIPNIEIKLLEEEDKIKLIRLSSADIKLKDYLYFYKDNLYLINPNKTKTVGLINDYFNFSDQIIFNNNQFDQVFNLLIPQLKRITNNFSVDEKLSKKIISEKPSFIFYFDAKDNKVICDLKITYGEEELIKNKYILRDVEAEDKVNEVLEKWCFYENKNSYVFNGKDGELFDFLKTGLVEVSEYGQVYYTDAFKRINIRKKKNISANISQKNRDLLEINFKIDDIDKEEVDNIIASVKDKRKFYKLRDGSFIDLEDENIDELKKLIDSIIPNGNSSLLVNKSKSMYLDEKLKEFDNIQFSGLEVIHKMSDKLKDVNLNDYVIPKDLKGNLREYQVTGFKWFKTLSYLELGGILADEMGLGKTIQTIAFLLSEKGKKTIIVTPTSLIYNWESEFKKFGPSLKIKLIHGNKNARIKEINSDEDYDVILTTYGMVKNDIEDYEDIEFDYCIIDEGQNIKNPNSLNATAVKRINSKSKFILTGTPIENGLLELWSQFDFIMPGYLYDEQLFKDSFVKDDNIKQLQMLIKPFILRRIKKEVIKELPDKIEKKILVDITDEQKKVYKAVVDKTKEDFEDIDPNQSRMEVLAALTKLREICLDPSLVFKDYNGGSGKVDALIELVEQYIQNDQKILIFSQFTSMLNIIGDYLSKDNIEYYYLDGTIKASERINLVNDFNKNDEIKVFLISLKAGGSGLNLTSANVVIHFDPWWNPAIEDQASDRAHRIGQKQVVEVIKIIAKDTIEEKVLDLQIEKRELIDKVINEDKRDDVYITKISTEDLMKLI